MANITASRKYGIDLSSPQLQDLSDEIILKIFSFLHQKDLLQVAQVSKRTSVISKDSSLWGKVNFQWITVTTSFLQQVINRRCKDLNLGYAKLEGTLNLTGHSELKTLDISNCKANEGVLEELLGSCHSLEKIGMMNLTTISPIMLKIVCEQNGRTLQFLNMKDCKGLFPLNAIELITSNCTQLSSLYLLNVKISEDAVNHLLNFLNPNIECLSFGYGHVVEDSHVEILVKRFKKIKQLGIKSRRISNLTVDHIVNNLKGTLRLLHLEAENIFCEKLQDLKAMKQLQFLTGRRLRHNDGRRSEEIKRLRELLTNVKDIHISSV